MIKVIFNGTKTHNSKTLDEKLLENSKSFGR